MMTRERFAETNWKMSYEEYQKCYCPECKKEECPHRGAIRRVPEIDGVPVCITRSNKRASDIVSYLSGYEVEINDGKLKKQLDKIRDKK